MDKLSDLINQDRGRKDSEETALLKDWFDKFFPESKIGIKSSGDNILIVCPSGVLAQEIHMKIPQIREHSDISENRKIIIRISQDY